MILFDLKCDTGHRFEAWFRDRAGFESQRKSRTVQCPVCGSSTVDKAPMAPKLVRSEGRDRPESAAERAPKKPAGATKMLRVLRDHVEKNCDFVGDRFAEEARKVHYGEVERHNIYGNATREETRELRDEGIEFGEIPWLPRHDS